MQPGVSPGPVLVFLTRFTHSSLGVPPNSRFQWSPTNTIRRLDLNPELELNPQTPQVQLYKAPSFSQISSFSFLLSTEAPKGEPGHTGVYHQLQHVVRAKHYAMNLQVFSYLILPNRSKGRYYQPHFTGHREASLLWVTQQGWNPDSGVHILVSLLMLQLPCCISRRAWAGFPASR